MVVTACGAAFFFAGSSPSFASEFEYGGRQLLTAAPRKQAPAYPKEFSGRVSWYGPKFHGKRTASGEIFDMNKLTAAHLKLPFHTSVQVEDPRTGNIVIVRVNDRGPFVKDRVMDMSREAARKLGTLSRGVAFVDCLVLDGNDG